MPGFLFSLNGFESCSDLVRIRERTLADEVLADINGGLLIDSFTALK
jgi:hypothetical protein